MSADPSLCITDAYKRIIPIVVNAEGARSAMNYVNCVKQFSVEDNPRYVRGHTGGKETYCNIFDWDCTISLMCEIPHWVDPATGAATEVGKGVEQNANTVCKWMRVHSLDQGWMKCSEKKARDRASLGYPTVVVWENIGGIGHVAMVLPGTDFTHIAQAGGTNFFDKDLHVGFGSVGPLEFYTHD